MQAHIYGKLRDVISAPRLDAYRHSGDSDFDVICKYMLNKTLCESLYPSLQALEVALRNSIHRAAAQRYKKDNWFDSPGWGLYQPEQEKIDYVKAELGKSGKPPDPERIVAELTFGFWASLFDSRYDKVWHKIILPTFPAMPRLVRTRQTLSKRLNAIRRLRNRVFHHERITHWSNLTQHHADILEAIGWISPEKRQLLAAIDRFPQVLTGGEAKVRTALASWA